MDFQYCPLCATPLHWQELFGRPRQQCPACGWIHFLDPKVGVGVLAVQNNAVLLVKRGIPPGKGLWCIPSGFMEADESPRQTALRECKEETGLDIELTGLLEVYYYNADFRGAGIIVVYTATVIGGELTPMDDAAAVQFFTTANLPPDDAIAFDSNRLILAAWKNKKELPYG